MTLLLAALSHVQFLSEDDLSDPEVLSPKRVGHWSGESSGLVWSPAIGQEYEGP